jgi:hypothetical protein
MIAARLFDSDLTLGYTADRLNPCTFPFGERLWLEQRHLLTTARHKPVLWSKTHLSLASGRIAVMGLTLR